MNNLIPDFAKDIRLNISSLLNNQDQDDLTNQQIMMIALACAYATQSEKIIAAISEYASTLSEAEITAAKSAASIMAMNNVYYRFVHLVSDNDYQTMPAKLRMNVIANPGVEKVDFELMSLAVSAINGCGLCIDSHVKTLEKHGVSKLAIQAAVRIAAVVNAFKQAVAI